MFLGQQCANNQKLEMGNKAIGHPVTLAKINKNLLYPKLVHKAIHAYFLSIQCHQAQLQRYHSLRGDIRVHA